MPAILVVDDEKSVIELVKFNLLKQGWDVLEALDGYTAIDAAVKNKPDLIVLDIMLPGIDGLEVCRCLKANVETESIPIIMLSAKSEEFDIVLGLEMGADDYLTKPFSPRELIARIKARLRKQGGDNAAVPSGNKIKTGNITMNPDNFETRVNGSRVELTLKEFELLRLLISNPGKVYTRNFLLESIWKGDYSHDTRTVDVHIRHIREKIEEDSANPKLIVTIRGVGYRYNGVDN